MYKKKPLVFLREALFWISYWNLECWKPVVIIILYAVASAFVCGFNFRPEPVAFEILVGLVFNKASQLKLNVGPFYL